MPVPYPAEIRERAVRLVIEARQNPATRDGAITRIAKQLDLLPETVRKWVRRAEIDEGIRSGTTTGDAARIAELEREVRELRRANQMADSTGGRNEFRELLRWCQISERLAWSAVERVLNRGQVRAANDAQIGALRKVLA